MTFQKGKFIYGIGFDITATNDIIREILSISADPDITAAVDGCVYWNSKKKILESPILHKAIYNDYSSPLKECAYKVVAKLADPLLADQIGLRYDCKVIHYRNESRYGFINKSAGKMQALRQLADMLNIQLSENMAFGDDLNDIEMLTGCGYGVAVENAVPEVKQVADSICESNDDDGVAKYIEQNVFHER